MAIRFRVYPSYASQMGGVGMAGNVMHMQNRFMQAQLNNQQKLSELQLKYERALWGERLDKVRMEERLRNPFGILGGQLGGFGGLGGNPYMMGGVAPAWNAGFGFNQGGFWGGIRSFLF